MRSYQSVQRVGNDEKDSIVASMYDYLVEEWTRGRKLRSSDLVRDIRCITPDDVPMTVLSECARSVVARYRQDLVEMGYEVHDFTFAPGGSA